MKRQTFVSTGGPTASTVGPTASTGGPTASTGGPTASAGGPTASTGGPTAIMCHQYVFGSCCVSFRVKIQQSVREQRLYSRKNNFGCRL